MKQKNYKLIIVVLFMVAVFLCTVSMDNKKDTSNANNLVAVSNKDKAKAVSIKKYGAVGDGVSNDFDAIAAAVSSGAKDIYIPAGKYECGGNTIVLSQDTRIHGDGIDKSILSNLMIDNTNGLSLEGVTLNGGAEISLTTPGGRSFKAKCGVVSHPSSSECYVSYSKVKFCNMEYGSYACETSFMSYDKAVNCIFQELGRGGIYHSINIGHSSYNGNAFRNIGRSSIANGSVSAIWIGDVTNNTNCESDNVNIYNNQFSDLYTGNDSSFQPHLLNANFISVRAKKAEIKNNKLYRIRGYGCDREAIYTKVKDLLVENNYIKDGGVDEGYICCKGQAGIDTYNIVRNNTIEGSYGSGIHLFGAGEIKNNTITLRNSKDAIVCHNNDVESVNELLIDGNTISIVPDYLTINGAVVNSYTRTSAIYVDSSKYKVKISNNNISVDNSKGIFESIVECAAIVRDISIINNTINSSSIGATGIFLHAGEDYAAANGSITVDISDNKVSTDKAAFQINFINQPEVSSNRSYRISNNLIFNNTDGYLVTVVSGDNNNDTLVYRSTQENTGLERVNTNVSRATN